VTISKDERRMLARSDDDLRLGRFASDDAIDEMFAR